MGCKLDHSVQVIATEHGVADLRGHSPHERAGLIIERCADPQYRPLRRNICASASPPTHRRILSTLMRCTAPFWRMATCGRR
ncbi:MAG: hypothetical protein JHD33_03620 [Chthoniobacterales bacterium]|nr:hypothetical protein [Chthoniobacterales bacterium]